MKYLVFLSIFGIGSCLSQGKVIQHETHIENGKIKKLSITKEFDADGNLVKVDSSLTVKDYDGTPDLHLEYHFGDNDIGVNTFFGMDSSLTDKFFHGFPFFEDPGLNDRLLPNQFGDIEEGHRDQIEYLLRRYRDQIERYYEQFEKNPAPKERMFIPENQKTSKI